MDAPARGRHLADEHLLAGVEWHSVRLGLQDGEVDGWAGQAHPVSASRGGNQVPLGVEDFRRGAELGDELRLQVDGENFKLIASGKTPSGRSVAWVEGGDATGMFVSALKEAYGERLSQAIASELGLQAAQGKPLSSRVVTQALSMAETAGHALDGVRFAEQVSGKP